MNDGFLSAFGALHISEELSRQNQETYGNTNSQRKMDAGKPSKESGNKNSQPEVKANLVTRCCKHCGRNEDIQEYINNVDAENDKLKKQNTFLTEELTRVQSELHELTDKMAQAYKRHNPGITESSGNKINPSDIANMLQGVYDGAFQRLADTCDDEREGLEKLKRILTCAYRYCKDEARLQIQRLLQPNAISVVKTGSGSKEDNKSQQRWEDTMLRQFLSESDIQEVYRLRFDIAQTNTVTQYVTSECKDVVLARYGKENMVLAFRKSRDERRDEEDAYIAEDLMEYYEQCAKCCWLIATCWPPIQLMFCHKHQPFDDETQKFFRVIDRDNDSDIDGNCVTQVVWPAVVQVLKDKTGCYKQGYLYVNGGHSQRLSNILSRDEAEKSSNGNASPRETEC